MELPPYLLNAWRLEHGAEAKAKKTEQLKGWTASSLAEAHVKYQLDKYYAAVHRVSALPNRSGNLPSLSTIAAAKTLDVLANSPDLPADVKTTAESLSSTTLKQLLHDPRIPYQVLRLFCATPQARAVADIDEAILRHERYVRSVPDIDRDGRCLVILEDLCRILCETPQGGSPMVFTRKIPPKGGLEVLDELRQRTITIHSTNASYSGAFDRITRGIMRGLDWNNILLAGGMALTTLLHTDDSHDDDRAIRNSDLDLYIYGLGPEEANRKAQEIHDTWVRNLPPTAGRRMVVKNAKTINFLTSYPNRRIQIVLKLLPSPTDVLLNFDLDACAIGFDGTQVLMLPRCARAIETGYSVFTMDLVWGHSLGDRRASQDFRVFKYAERGFGIRFLPSYARSLEEDCLESMVFPTSESATNGDEMNEDTTSIDGKGPAPSNWRQMERKPHGREPGLKTLKRIAYLGQDYVNRYYFGITPLAVSPARYRREAPGGMYIFWGILPYFELAP